MKPNTAIGRSAAALACALAAGPTIRAAEVPPAGSTRVEVDFNQETRTRQEIIQTALGREPADLVIRGANVLNVFTLSWMPDSAIVIKGERIVWVGPESDWKGTAAACSGDRFRWTTGPATAS